MKSLFPNMRWISVPSEALGEDWYEKSQQIDGALSAWGMELSEEAVFLLFDRAPGALLEGEGTCRVARPVIGNKRTLPAPYVLEDWAEAIVHRQTFAAKTWPSLLGEAFESWQDLQREGKNLRPDFVLCLRRRLGKELIVEAEGIFRE